MKHSSSQHAVVLARCLLLLASGACQAPLSHSSDPSVFRCDTNGLCIRTDNVGSKSLVGGYRRGDEEMKFEVLYRPTANPELPAWCERLQDSKGQRISTSDGPGCPLQWSAGSWDGGPIRAGMQNINERNDMLRGLLADLQFGRAPAGREEAWKKMTDIVERMYEERTFDLAQEFLRKRHGNVPTMSSGHPGAVGDANSDGHTPSRVLLPTKKKTDAQHLWPAAREWRIPSWMTGIASPAEFVSEPSWEFQQSVQLYARPVKEYLLAGQETTMDHSASRIRVFGRPLDSSHDTPWVKVGEHESHNHGAGPDDPGMALYATCENLPITRGYFAWKGECPGDWWHDHLCNDDTAYQVWHAYGNWSPTPDCPRARRVYRVFCRQMWAPQLPPTG